MCYINNKNLKLKKDYQSMKKAKFNDNFKMIAGSCIGHFNGQEKQCSKCKMNELCQQRTRQHIFPKNEKQVKSIVNKFLGQDK